MFRCSLIPLFTFLLVISSVLVPANKLKADGPPMQWQKIFGSDYAEGSSVQQTSDGGYIIVGTTSSNQVPPCVYLIKTNSVGNMQWQKTFSGSGDYDEGYSVQQTSDGGYIIAGAAYTYYESPPGEIFCSSDVYLIKTNSNGNMQWQKTFGGGGDDSGSSVRQTSDGGYIIAGNTGGSVYLVKTNSAGDMQWQKTFDGYFGSSVQQTTDGGYIIAGSTISFGDFNGDVYLIKTNSAGNMQWQKTFGGHNGDFGYSVQQTTDGGYIITGETDSYGVGEGDVYLIKTNSSGDMQWQKTFGGSNIDWGNSVWQTSNGGYIIAGETYRFDPYTGGNGSVYLIKTNSSGDMQWQKTFGGIYHDSGSSVQQTSDGGYIITGTAYTQVSEYSYNSKVYLIKLGPDDVELSAKNNWDGKTISLTWGKNAGNVGIYRRKETGAFEYIKTVFGTSYKDNNVPEPGKNYTYVLKNANDVNISNEANAVAEVIVVLVRGYDAFGSGVDSNYWKSDSRYPELVDVNGWFAQNNVTCWDPSPYLNGTHSVDRNAGYLTTYLDSKRVGIYKDAKINLIGHSMGGLISRKYANDHPGIVNNIFAIQTPHTGSPLATLRDFWPNNEATYCLTPTYTAAFNKSVQIGNTLLFSTYSANSSSVCHDPALISGALAIAGLPLFNSNSIYNSMYFPNTSDGVVPTAAAQGKLWLINQIYIKDFFNSDLDHYSCYRHPKTLAQIMTWMGLPCQQTESLSMPFKTLTEESNEPQIKPQYLVVGFEGQFDSNTPVTKTVPIGNSTIAYFRAITSDTNCSFTLTDPCGTIYDSNYVLTAHNVSYEKLEGLSLYEVNSPKRGIWTLNLSTTVSSPNTVNYSLTVFEDANITLYSYTNSDWANTNANVLISARLVENNNPIIDVNVTAEIILPDSNTVAISLYDDGLHNDVNACDGIYANTFTATARTGIYTGQVTAKGSSVYGEFERTSPLSFTISASDINFAGDINDVGIDLNGNGLYDNLKFIVPVNVNEANSFLLTATLLDNNDNIIKMLTTDKVNLPAGPNNLILQISAEEIAKYGVNGPYKLRNITLSDANGLIIAVHPDHNTPAYLLNNFEPLDTDHDGLPDYLERLIGTDVNLPDSDFDGVSDYDEIHFDGDANSYNPATDLNPLNPDTDNDGMSDGWEIYFGYDPLHDNGEKNNDDDNDGLTNLQEYQNNTDPNNNDTDFDGMPDGWEVRYGFNPVAFDSSGDFDNDGMTNLEEYLTGHNPLVPDVDGDFNHDRSINTLDLAIFADQWLLEKLSFDINHDGIVNFLDFAVFANNWHGDMNQLSQFASQWLQRSATNADIAPAPGGDGIVNFLDFALFAENWLKQN
jgi:pimeloyl-ACP methyl ester carboxylesterase